MEVLGPQHEIRLPKNLIVTVIASMLFSYNQTIIPRNESVTMSTMISLKVGPGSVPQRARALRDGG